MKYLLCRKYSCHILSVLFSTFMRYLLTFVIFSHIIFDWAYCRKLEVQSPMYTNLNRVQAQVFSNITASLRINDSINCNLQEIQTNLVPYPRIHFPLIAFAPIITPQKGQYNLSIRNITYDCFQPANQVCIRNVL